MGPYREAAAVAAIAVLIAAGAHGADEAARVMLAKWGGSYDADALLREPAVRDELQKLLGKQLPHLERNLNVKGAIDVIGSILSISGNAPHQGTLEEAVVCVRPTDLAIEAAILSRGMITVFSRAQKYEYATLCIKDWITLANSRHVDRLSRPKNVRVVNPR